MATATASRLVGVQHTELYAHQGNPLRGVCPEFFLPDESADDVILDKAASWESLDSALPGILLIAHPRLSGNYRKFPLTIHYEPVEPKIISKPFICFFLLHRAIYDVLTSEPALGIPNPVQAQKPSK